MNGPTQTARVIRAARSYRGVCQVDLMAPDVVDGGAPITRLAARIFDAERQGFTFEIIGWRKRTKVYRLASEPEPESTEAAASGDRPLKRDVGLPRPQHQAGAAVSVDPEPEPLFTVEPRTAPHWDEAA